MSKGKVTQVIKQSNFVKPKTALRRLWFDSSIAPESGFSSVNMISDFQKFITRVLYQN